MKFKQRELQTKIECNPTKHINSSSNLKHCLHSYTEERERERERMAGIVVVSKSGVCGGGGGGKRTRAARTAAEEEEEEEQQSQLSLVAFLLAALRKSMVGCKVDRPDDVISTVHHMEIGWPTNVQHITHVTFDRFNGFLGLPVEFEVEIPGRVPSARYFTSC